MVLIPPARFIIMMVDGWTVDVKESAIPNKTALATSYL